VSDERDEASGVRERLDTARSALPQLQDRIDRLQQRFAVTAFPVGVWLRYREDRGHEYAALWSYYGIFSLFPLLMVLTTVVGYLFPKDSELRRQIVAEVYERIPVLGPHIQEQIESIQGNGWALLIGIVIALWAGLGVVQASQDAFNLMWGVPIVDRPGFVPKRLRSLGALAIIGGGLLVATVASAVVAFVIDASGPARVAGWVASTAINAAVLLASFKVLTEAPLRWRALLPGALIAGVALWLLQMLGGFYLSGVVAGASEVYGAFAAVIGLMVWMALLARVVLYGAEVNVVAAKRLWPRSFTGKLPTDADERSFTELSERDIRRL